MRPDIAGWSSLVARRAHNPEVVGSNPAPATKFSQALRGLFSYLDPSMRYMFSSCAFTTIDFRGFDPSTLTDLFYTFSGCSHLTTIYADASWALPSSGITGSQCFYSCSTSLVGGNGTAWASNKTAYTYFRIDTASTPGYITIA